MLSRSQAIAQVNSPRRALPPQSPAQAIAQPSPAAQGPANPIELSISTSPPPRLLGWPLTKEARQEAMTALLEEMDRKKQAPADHAADACALFDLAAGRPGAWRERVAGATARDGLISVFDYKQLIHGAARLVGPVHTFVTIANVENVLSSAYAGNSWSRFLRVPLASGPRHHLLDDRPAIAKVLLARKAEVLRSVGDSSALTKLTSSAPGRVGAKLPAPVAAPAAKPPLTGLARVQAAFAAKEQARARAQAK